MKRIASLILVLCLGLSLFGCGGGDKPAATDGGQPADGQQQAEQQQNDKQQEQQIAQASAEAQPSQKVKEDQTPKKEEVPEAQADPAPASDAASVPESDFEDQQFFYEKGDSVTLTQAEATAKTYLPAEAKEVSRKENAALGFCDITYSDGTYEYLVRISYMPDGASFDKEHVNILDIMLN